MLCPVTISTHAMPDVIAQAEKAMFARLFVMSRFAAIYFLWGWYGLCGRGSSGRRNDVAYGLEIATPKIVGTA
jgi:hypothetical protein